MPEQREIGHGGGEERKGEVKAIHSPVLFQLYHKNIPILLSHFLCFIQFRRGCVNLVNGENAIFFCLPVGLQMMLCQIHMYLEKASDDDLH